MRIATLLLAFGLQAFAQNQFSQIGQDHYVAQATTTAMTLQQPAQNGRQITFGSQTVAGVSVYCAAAQTATLSWNGTPATSIAGTEIRLPGAFGDSGMTVWTASNVGTGTVGPLYNIPAGATFALDLTWFVFGRQPNANITIKTSGTCTITFSYSAV